MKRVVIGTAGHVDHGKTSLIKALTGIDCDRLKEEKERGLTIELGFASLVLPSGERVGVVDVPGHVRFIRHMLSGASGIDLVLLVIASDEGVMPQTLEHVQICELLGIGRGVIALTKADLVDNDLLELALSDVKEFISGNFLKDAPIVAVSSTTGQGLDALREEIERQVSLVHERQTGGIPILPVDRVFSIKGFGTVVTGTLARGTFSPDQEVELLPGGKRARIRNLQVHDEDVRQALAGMRTAINLQGLGADDITRGEWVVPVGVFTPSKVLDGKINLVGKPGKGGIKLYIGTTEVLGSIRLHQVDGQHVARIRLKEKIVASYGDRFILRTVSPSATLGGGMVLNPHPGRRFSEEVIRDLLSDDLSRQIAGLARDAGMHGISHKSIVGVFPEAGPRTDKLIQGLLTSGEIIRFDAVNDIYVHAVYQGKLKELLAEKVKEFHKANPLSPGISKEHLRTSLQAGVDPKLFNKVLLDLIRKDELRESGPNITVPGFSATLDRDHKDLGEKISSILEDSGFEPPKTSELSESLSVPSKDLMKILGFLAREGRIVKIKDDLYLSKNCENRLKDLVRTFIVENRSLAPADMKTIVGASRKYAIPYLEYLDRIHFTMRVGDVRRLSSTKQ
jgi:selenocysteine-specific elongation factor